MKARVKATGALLEVRLQDVGTEYPYICDMQGEGGTLWKESELEFLDDDPTYWTRLEHQYAGMAMQGILSNEDYCKLLINEAIKGSFAEDVSRCASDFAHTLVQKLKEKEERK